MSTEEIIFPPHAPETRASRLADVMRRVSALPIDKPGRVTIGEDTRTLRQNRYLFSVYRMVAMHMRETHGVDHGAETWHQWFKGRALEHTIEMVQGHPTRVYLTTTKLTRSEFTAYVDRIAEICADELDFIVSPPDPDLVTRRGRTEDI